MGGPRGANSVGAQSAPCSPAISGVAHKEAIAWPDWPAQTAHRAANLHIALTVRRCHQRRYLSNNRTYRLLFRAEAMTTPLLPPDSLNPVVLST